VSGGEKISLGEYKSRRAALQKANGDAITILIGRTEKSGGDLRSGFFQEENFYYLTGWSEPGAMLVLTPSSEVLLIRAATRSRKSGPATNWQPRIRMLPLPPDSIR
jgi:Aminopeptidase P, N-terminal domain.